MLRLDVLRRRLVLGLEVLRRRLVLGLEVLCRRLVLGLELLRLACLYSSGKGWGGQSGEPAAALRLAG